MKDSSFRQGFKFKNIEKLYCHAKKPEGFGGRIFGPYAGAKRKPVLEWGMAIVPVALLREERAS